MESEINDIKYRIMILNQAKDMYSANLSVVNEELNKNKELLDGLSNNETNEIKVIKSTLARHTRTKDGLINRISLLSDEILECEQKLNLLLQ